MSRERKGEKCVICGKEYSVHINNKPYCNKHYQSMKRYGQPYGKKRENTNSFVVCDDVLKIYTHNGDLIYADSEDLNLLKKHSWCISKTGYAVARIGEKTIKMHRLLMNVIENTEAVVDHKDGNKLNNRKNNLRVCSQAENSRNKRVRNIYGVSGIRKTECGFYNVRITVNRKGVHIGNFKSLNEAIEARKRAEAKYHGEFGKSINNL